MKFQLYDNVEAFGLDTLDVLLKQEAQNNLLIGLISHSKPADTAGWLMASVKDQTGHVRLTVVCTPPYNLLLYETDNLPQDAAVQCLSDELKAMNYPLPGVMAEQSLAYRFATCHAGEKGFYRHHSLQVMRLDQLADRPKAIGTCRQLQEDDLFFAPYWAEAFARECRVEIPDISHYAERLRSRIGQEKDYFWIDRWPVSQAAHGRSTLHGAVLNAVYTPPYYRGKGYASSVTATLTQMLLERGYRFCCLFADTENPVSCAMYHKLGYIAKCQFAELHFGKLNQKVSGT